MFGLETSCCRVTGTRAQPVIPSSATAGKNQTSVRAALGKLRMELEHMTQRIRTTPALLTPIAREGKQQAVTGATALQASEHRLT